MAEWSPPQDQLVQKWTPPQSQLVQPDAPDTRGKARLPDDSNLSIFDRLWRGLSGGDVTVPGQVAKGMANPAYKAAQLGTRAMGAAGMGESALSAPELATQPMGRGPIEDVDKAVQQREERYTGQRKAAGQDTEGFFSNLWERVGELASPVTLAAGGAGGKLIGAAGSALGRIGLGSAVGAATAPMISPVTDTRERRIAENRTIPATKSLGGEVAKEAAGGAIGGAVGGAIGEGVGKLASALFGHDEQAVKDMLVSGYRRLVKPGRAGGSTAPQLRTENNQIVTAFDQIIQERKAAAKAQGPYAQPQYPDTLLDNVEALDANKRSLFDQYDTKLQEAAGEQALDPNPHMVERFRQTGAQQQQAENAVRDAQNRLTMASARRSQAGNVYQSGMAMPAERQAALQLQQAQALAQRAAQAHQSVAERMYKPYVDLAPVAQRLESMMRESRFDVLAPQAAAQIGGLAERLRTAGSFGLKETQDFLQALNTQTKAFWRNGANPSEANEMVAKVEMAGMLRRALDETITNLKGPGYRDLKLRYGAVRAVEREMANAYRREANKIDRGIGGIFADLFAAEQGIGAVLHLDPSRLATAVAAKSASRIIAKLRDPNRALQRLYAMRAYEPGQAEVVMGRLAGQARPALSAGGALGGGMAGGDAVRSINRARREEVTAPAGMR